MKRKGDVMIGWVLLIGFTITLGILVAQWMREQAEGTVRGIVEDVEGDVACVDVVARAFFADAPACTVLNVSNAGYHTIVEVKVRSDFGVDSFVVGVPPGGTVAQGLNTAAADVTVIPVVRAGERLIGCLDRKVVVAC